MSRPTKARKSYRSRGRSGLLSGPAACWAWGLLAVAGAACSHRHEASVDAALPLEGGSPAEARLPVEDASTSLAAAAADSGDASAEGEADAASGSVFAAIRYRRVLHTGDSMVGGGLCKALAPRFADEGAHFVRDPWESASIFAFAYTDHLPALMAKVKPDLVLLTLGANDVYGNVTKDFTRAIEKVVAITQRGGPRDCVWLGPPIWNAKYKPTVDAIREHAAPCLFYDSSDLLIARRPDRIHPTDRGGEVWADDFWKFFRGPGALALAPEGQLPHRP